MDIRRYFSLAVVLLAVLLTGCEDEKGKDLPIVEDSPNKKANEWIYKIMDENYLWYEELSAKKSSLDFDQEPDEFFKKLLSDNDGVKRNGNHFYFSTIEKKPEKSKAISETEPTYGFEYIVYSFTDADFEYARVLYVLPGSPAEEAGLLRDDWIVGMNGSDNNITDAFTTLEEGSDALTVKIAKPNYDKEGWTDKGDLTLSAAKIMSNTPLFKDSVYVYGDRKIGYLVYNHFSREAEGTDDGAYDTQMKSLFSEFKSEGVNEFVLDLRFNSGGLVTCAQLLSSLLAPANALGKNFCTLSYNDKKKNRESKLNFDSRVSASNLNLKRLYVLTGRFTASASEAVINCLKPYMDDVRIIGEKTIGKAVGSSPYGEDDDYEWILHPITLRIVNSEGKADYGQVGFEPDVFIDEYDYPFVKLLPLGDTKEVLLSAAIGEITGNQSKQFRSSGRSDAPAYGMTLKPVGSSLENKKTNGLIVPEGN
jgi:C-terminal processing protease CtpA/Prc